MYDLNPSLLASDNSSPFHFVLTVIGEGNLTFRCVDMHLLGAIRYADHVMAQQSESYFNFYFILIHLAVTIAAPDHRCIYCHPDKAQILTRQRNQCYSYFRIGILKVLLTISTGCIDSLLYIIQPYAH
jgi:hypothetical protein